VYVGLKQNYFLSHYVQFPIIYNIQVFPWYNYMYMYIHYIPCTWTQPVVGVVGLTSQGSLDVAAGAEIDRSTWPLIKTAVVSGQVKETLTSDELRWACINDRSEVLRFYTSLKRAIKGQNIPDQAIKFQMTDGWLKNWGDMQKSGLRLTACNPAALISA
jgi:hypothetical protein